MPDTPSLFVTVDWGIGVTTVTVCGVLDSVSSLQLQEQVAWAIENRPQRLVLDLTGVTDRCGDYVVSVIAGARRLLPSGCPLEIRSPGPAVRSLLETNHWPGVRIEAAGPEDAAVSRRG